MTSKNIHSTIHIGMRKISFLPIAVTFLALAPQAFATSVSACPTTGQFSKLCQLSAGSLQGIIGPAITFAFVMAALVALGYLIWGGIKWIISQGDKQAVEDARNHIIASIIGLVIIFMSYLIINIVLSFFGGSGTSLNNLQLPTLN